MHVLEPFGARGEFCVGTPLDEAFRALAGQFRGLKFRV